MDIDLESESKVEEDDDSHSNSDSNESGIIEPATKTNTRDGDDDEYDAAELNNFWQRQAKRVARSPCWFLWIFLLLGIALSMIAMIVGEFEVR